MNGIAKFSVVFLGAAIVLLTMGCESSEALKTRNNDFADATSLMLRARIVKIPSAKWENVKKAPERINAMLPYTQEETSGRIYLDKESFIEARQRTPLITNSRVDNKGLIYNSINYELFGSQLNARMEKVSPEGVLVEYRFEYCSLSSKPSTPMGPNTKAPVFNSFKGAGALILRSEPQVAFSWQDGKDRWFVLLNVTAE